MKQFAILAVLVFLAGTTGLAWADAASKDASKAEPQPLNPQGVQQVGGPNSGNNQDGDGIHLTDTHEGGGKDTGDGADDSNLHRVTGKKSQDDWEHKAGGKNVTLHDQSQISGNLSGSGNTLNNKGAKKGGGALLKNQNGMVKGEIGLHKNGAKGTQKVLIGLSKANNLQKANGLQKGNGFIKADNGFQKANGSLNGNLHNGAMGDGSVRGQ